MHPDPLIWMLSNDLLDHLCKLLGVDQHIALRIATSTQLNRWFESQPVFCDLRVPKRVPGHYRGIRVQCHACEPGCRASGRSEEIHEHTFVRHGVLIRKYPDRS